MMATTSVQVEPHVQVAARCCSVMWLGRTRYQTAWQLQRQLLDRRKRGHGQDVLILTEHEPVYTLGRAAVADHVLISEKEIVGRQIDLLRIERGGDVTFHGPGQLVGYPILDLRFYRPDVHYYLRQLEAVLVDTLDDFGIKAWTEPGLTGVWTAGGKVAAIGIHIVRWITMHGFALNVSTDLSYFESIVPCGIQGRAVASMSRLLGAQVTIEEVIPILTEHFARRLDYPIADCRLRIAD